MDCLAAILDHRLHDLQTPGRGRLKLQVGAGTLPPGQVHLPHKKVGLNRALRPPSWIGKPTEQSPRLAASRATPAPFNSMFYHQGQTLESTSGHTRVSLRWKSGSTAPAQPSPLSLVPPLLAVRPSRPPRPGPTGVQGLITSRAYKATWGFLSLTFFLMELTAYFALTEKKALVKANRGKKERRREQLLRLRKSPLAIWFLRPPRQTSR